MFQELESIREKYRQLTLSLSEHAFAGKPQKLKEISKERAELEPIIQKSEEYQKVQKSIRESKEIIGDPEADRELKQLAETELAELAQKEKKLEEEIRILLLPKDPNDEKNVILEIRAGAGGDESSLFAQDLFRMYSRFAEHKGWKYEVLQTSFSPIGGIKEVIVNIQGKKVYSFLKYESGVHRVQRVPKTEASGRIHTSTVTVAVLPEADEVDVRIDPKDLRIEAFGASGPGGPECQPQLHRDPGHSSPLRTGRLLPGRKISAPEQREGSPHSPLAVAGYGPKRTTGEDRPGTEIKGRDRGEERED